jgi:GNAT superfamily N-acetyltransferase
LQTAEEFERYVHFADEVYRQNPYWVPPDPHHLTSLLAGNKEAGPHWTVQPFWVESDGRILATVAAVVDKLYNSHWKERMGHLLFFEALPDSDEAVATLLETAGEWLRAQSCTAARLSFLYAWQLPWTIDAYEAVPTLFHTYNPPYYHSYAKNSGFRTEQGMVQYQVAFTPELAAPYREMVARAETTGVRLRSWDFSRLEEEGLIFARLVNETFAGHWASPQFSPAQMQGFALAFKDVLPPSFLSFAEMDGEPVGFVFSIPDLNQALHRLRGKTVGENMDEFQAALRQINHGVLLIIGVKPSRRGRGVNLALAARSYLAMIERGYKTASYTVVLDDNWPSRRTAEKLGGRVTRNFIIYRKELGQR